MRKSTKIALVFMLILLVLLIGVIVYLYLTDSKIMTTQEMGQTVIAEAAAEPAQPEPETPAPAPAPAPEPVQPTVVDLPNEKEMRLYLVDFGAHTAELVTQYSSNMDPSYDINTFEAINSEEPTITYDDYFALHESYWNAVQTQSNYKIGYELSFDVGAEHKQITILEPGDIEKNPDLFMGNADTDEVTGYMGVWVYNDIGQSGTYVHLTQADMTADTLMTSIKLRPTPQSDQISNLKLKVFSYSSTQEFDSAGHYIGTHGYEIPINKE